MLVRSSTPLPPGPRSPAVINTTRLLRRPLETLVAWQRRYGDVFTVRHLIFGTGVYVADPQAIRELLTGDQSDLHAGEANAPLSPFLGPSSVLVLDGPEHLRQRKLLLPPFQGSAVTQFRETIRAVAEAEVGRWRDGQQIVLRERMRHLTFDVICRAVFGVDDPALVERLRAAFAAAIDMSPVIFTPVALQREFGGHGPWAMLQRRIRVADELLYAEIRRRRAEPDLEDRTDVLSLLMRARDEEGRSMTDSELRDELVTMLAAGHETTATALAFTFDLLGRHPEVVRRIREESETGGDEYVNAVATESLRIRPVIDASERTLTKPRNVAGFELPAGIRVYPAIALVHRRRDLYGDPERFRPERFLEGKVESYAWLPFGGGIRRCIGAALAQAEMAEVLRTVTSRVELRPLRPRLDPVVMRGITMVPKHGVPVEVSSVA